MTQYIIVYIGGNQPSTPEEGKQHFARYQAWLSSLGDSAISPMNPLKNTNLIDPEGTVSNESITKISGYTIVEAQSMNEALEMAKSCPFLNIGGSLEVSELIQIS